MSRRGSYIGGHTIVGPKSGWFSKGKIKAKKRKSALTADELAALRRRLAESQEMAERQRKGKQELLRMKKEAEAESKAAKRAARNTPEKVAERAQKAAERRAEQEAKMAKVVVERVRLRLIAAPKGGGTR